MKLKNKLVITGLSLALATGICAYFGGQKDYLTYEEYKAQLQIYNNKLNEIREDCENDVRCNKGKIIFRKVKDKKDVLNQLNQWVSDDIKNPKIYKLKK